MTHDTDDNGTGVRSTAWARVRTPLTLVARLLLGLVFAFSALSKITAPGLFRQNVTEYGLLPYGLIGPFAAALPWIEVLVAIYLVIGLFLRPTAVVTAALLVMFTGALVISILRGNTAFGCSCFSGSGPIGSLAPVQWLAGGSKISWFDVTRDLVFILLAAVVYWGDRYTLSVEGLLFKPVVPLDDEADYDDEEIVTTAPATGLRARKMSGARSERG